MNHEQCFRHVYIMKGGGIVTCVCNLFKAKTCLRNGEGGGDLCQTILRITETINISVINKNVLLLLSK